MHGTESRSVETDMTDEDVQPRSPTRPSWRVAVGIFLLASTVYVLLGRAHEVPLIFPDELIYGHLAQSVARGEGLEWRGESQPLKAALYVYALAPSWMVASGTAAYGIAKAIGAVLICATALPVWFLARRYVAGRFAVLAVALTLCGTWMTTSAELLTENLALPLATGCLVAMVMVLSYPGSAWTWVAIGLAAATTLARFQLAVLVPVLAVALAIDIASQGRDWTARLRAHRQVIATLAVVAVAAFVVLVRNGASTFGIYSDIEDFDPSVADLVGAAAQYAYLPVVMSGLLPAAAALAFASRRSSWSDNALRPLLIVLTACTSMLVLQAAWFGAGMELGWTIERYVEYPLPLLFVLFSALLARRAFDWGRTFAIALALAALAIIAADVREAVEERAIFGTVEVVTTVLRMPSGLAVCVFGVITTGAALVVARRGASKLGVGVVVVVALVLPSQATWRWSTDATRTWSSQFPGGVDWVDRHSPGPVARLLSVVNWPLNPTIEFFNEDIKQVYAPERHSGTRIHGRTCTWSISSTGHLEFADGCGPTPTRIWNSDPLVRLTFHRARLLATNRWMGQIFDIDGPPRIKTAIKLPCNLPTVRYTRTTGRFATPDTIECSEETLLRVWLERPSRLELVVRGSGPAQTVRLGGRSWSISPDRMTTISVDLGRGPSEMVLPLGGLTSATAPRIVSATLHDGATVSPLI